LIGQQIHGQPAFWLEAYFVALVWREDDLKQWIPAPQISDLLANEYASNASYTFYIF
jgi:hypothetical protein